MNNLKAQISLISGILLMIPCILFATAISTPADSLQNLLKDDDLKANLSDEEIKQCFDYSYYTKNVDRIFKRVFGE